MVTRGAAGTVAVPADHLGARGVSTAFGTFGELLQGVLPEPDGDFLVTFPIARWTTASFRFVPTAVEVTVDPPQKLKALRLARMILRSAGVPGGGSLRIDSSLPEGKGLASSSADLVAAARAVGNALGMPLPPEAIERFLARIEPTDGVLYPEIVAFHHRSVRLRARLGSLPMMAIVALDEGGTVDTVAFNQLDKPFSSADQREYAQLLARLTAAIAARDLTEVGRVATRSAEMNQLLRPKRALDRVLAICRDVGALGVAAAHSGTVLGLMLDLRDPEYAAKLAAAIKACSALAPEVTLYRSLCFD